MNIDGGTVNIPLFSVLSRSVSSASALMSKTYKRILATNKINSPAKYMMMSVSCPDYSIAVSAEINIESSIITPNINETNVTSCLLCAPSHFPSRFENRKISST